MRNADQGFTISVLVKDGMELKKRMDSQGIFKNRASILPPKKQNITNGLSQD